MQLIDIIAIVVIFAIVGYVGYRSSKQVKDMDDFTLAGSKLGKIQAGFSMAATEFGGSSLIGAMAFCYVSGISGVWWNWSSVPALMILGIFFAGRIKLPGLVTVTDFFGLRYDKKTKNFATVMHLFETGLQISTQFLVGAVALNGIFGISKTVGLIATVLFVMLYTVGGGLIAVVNTDVVQFIVLVISIIVVLPLSIFKAGGMDGLQAALPAEFFSLTEVDAPTILSWCLLGSFVYATNQHYVQRIFASKDTKTARFSFIFTGGCYIVYGLCIAVIGICIAALIPGLSDPNLGYAILVRDYMPAGIRGIVLGGIFAASMSTADSMLLSASTIFVHDIYIPLKKGKTTTDGELRILRIITVLVSLFAMVVSMFADNIISLMYVSGLFYSTAVFLPLIVGLFSRRVNEKGAFAAMISTAVSGLFSEVFLAGKVDGILGMPSNLLALIVGGIVLLSVSLITGKPAPEKTDFLKARN